MGGGGGGARGSLVGRERENSNSKTLFYKDCSLGLVKNLSRWMGERQRQKDRERKKNQTKKQTTLAIAQRVQ